MRGSKKYQWCWISGRYINTCRVIDFGEASEIVQFKSSVLLLFALAVVFLNSCGPLRTDRDITSTLPEWVNPGPIQYRYLGSKEQRQSFGSCVYAQVNISIDRDHVEQLLISDNEELIENIRAWEQDRQYRGYFVFSNASALNGVDALRAAYTDERIIDLLTLLQTMDVCDTPDLVREMHRTGKRRKLDEYEILIVGLSPTIGFIRDRGRHNWVAGINGDTLHFFGL